MSFTKRGSPGVRTDPEGDREDFKQSTSSSLLRGKERDQDPQVKVKSSKVQLPNERYILIKSSGYQVMQRHVSLQMEKQKMQNGE